MMRLALLLMALLTSGCAAPVTQADRAGWTSPNYARPGRETPTFLEIE
ncbi:MAG TPA: hypothetical protein VIO94_16040 [Phenylobacterium sp.]